MRTFTTRFKDKEHFKAFVTKHHIDDSSQMLIQVFSTHTSKRALMQLRDDIVALFPSATLIGTTTDGAVYKGKVVENQHIVTLTRFTHVTLRSTFVPLLKKSVNTGKRLATALWSKRAKLLLTFTDGLHMNGEDFLSGIHRVAPDAKVAGGMASDGGSFHQTFVFNETDISSKGAVGVVLEGEKLYVTTDYSFDWFPIGQPMRITRAKNNRVYRIEHRNAIDTYAHYLGENVARKLPSIGIDFPLIIHRNGTMIARAVMAKHDDGSLSFGGALQEGDEVTFGYGNPELILAHAPKLHRRIAEHPVQTVFIYSCTARKRLMPHLIEYETRPFSQMGTTSGFFTHGEFFTNDTPHMLNQTMTVVALSESKQAIPKKPSFTLLPQTTQKLSVEALSHLLQTTTKELRNYNETLKKRAEELQAQKTSLQLAQEVGRFGSWEINLQDKSAVWSEELYRIFGFPFEFRPDADTLFSLVETQEKHKLKEALRNAYKEGTAEVETVIRRPNGEIVHVWINIKTIFDQNKHPIKLIGTTLDITELVTLREQNKELATIIEESNQEIYIVEAKSKRILYANKMACDTSGYGKELIGLPLFHIVTSLTKENFLQLEKTLAHQRSVLTQQTHTTKSKRSYPVQSYIQKGIYSNTSVYILFDVDITELMEAKSRYQHQAQILEQILDGVISFDTQGNITLWNRGATILYGYGASEMIGKPIRSLYPESEHSLLDAMIQKAEKENAASGEIIARKRNGDLFHTFLSLSALKNERDEIIGYTAYSYDITEQKEIEETLRLQTEMLDYQAHHDMLTDLPNRIYFEKYLQETIEQAKTTNELFALLFIDLDNFKHVNDSLGHHFGDELLKIVAKRLQNEIRQSDFLARLGGDEFIIVLRHLYNENAAAKVAKKIIRALNETFIIQRHRLHISASIGISLFPTDAVTYHNLLKFADTAMYHAKENGKNAFTYYDPKMTLSAYKKVSTQLNLRQAFDHNELHIHYQPIFDIATRKEVGIEALLRWEHPEKGLLYPKTFLSVAQELDYVRELNRFVLQHTMQEYMSLRRSLASDPGYLALNVSANEILNDGFIAGFKQILKSTGFDPTLLIFEISENEVHHNFDTLKIMFEKLRRIGVRINIDDFGTGDLSLQHLQELPIHALKIDVSLIETLPKNKKNATFVKSAIALSKTLNIDIVAEGVEKEEQLVYLEKIGCKVAQGYYYAKALSLEALKRFLHEQEDAGMP